MHIYTNNIILVVHLIPHLHALANSIIIKVRVHEQMNLYVKKKLIQGLLAGCLVAIAVQSVSRNRHQETETKCCLWLKCKSGPKSTKITILCFVVSFITQYILSYSLQHLKKIICLLQIDRKIVQITFQIDLCVLIFEVKLSKHARLQGRGR